MHRRSFLCLLAGALMVGVACSSAPPTHVTTHPSATTSEQSSVASAPAASGSWLTYQHDPGRSGDVAAGPDAGSIHEAWASTSVDGDVYAQPLVFGRSVIVATENNSVYSLSATSGKVQWRAHLGVPVPQSELPCGDIDPTGITGTPVVDPSTKTVYAVAFEEPAHHVLAAIDTDTGRIRWTEPVDDPQMDPLVQQQRGALLLDGGRVYVAYGGLFGDCGEYHGWVTSVGEDGGGPFTSYQVPSDRAAGIWTPAGPSSDDAGHIFVATGNSFSTSTFDYGNSVIELSRDLTPQGYFAPENWAELNGSDVDIGSTGPLLLPHGLLFQIGKEGAGYVLDRSHLGGIGGDVFHQTVCSGGAFGATAFAAGTIFVACTDGLVALDIDADGSFARAWSASGIFAGPPVVGNDIVWTITRDGELQAFETASGHRVFNATLGEVANFAALALTDNCIFAPAKRQIHAFCES